MISRPMRGQGEGVTRANEVAGPSGVPRRNFTTRAGGGGAAALHRDTLRHRRRRETQAPSSIYAPAAKTFGFPCRLLQGTPVVSEKPQWAVTESELESICPIVEVLLLGKRRQDGKTGGASYSSSSSLCSKAGVRAAPPGDTPAVFIEIRMLVFQ